MEEQRRTTDFTGWSGEELEYLVDQLKGMHSWYGATLKSDAVPTQAQVALMEATCEDYWKWYRATSQAAIEALVTVRKCELEKAENVRAVVGLQLGLVSAEG